MEVDKLMTRGAKSCGPNESCNEAARIMWECDCGCVPVVDASGKVIAMITDRDICMAAYMRGKTLSEIPISTAASRTVVSVRENDRVEAAERLMQEHQIRRVPVVDANGQLVGVLSMNDIARCVQQTTRPGDGVSPQEVAKTLTAVSQPHRNDSANTARPHAA